MRKCDLCGAELELGVDLARCDSCGSARPLSRIERDQLNAGDTHIYAGDRANANDPITDEERA